MAPHVTFYTRRWCGYCTAAERLLEQRGVPYERIDTTGDHLMRRWLVDKTGRSTMPQVFVDGVPIGGYDDLRALDRKGELERVLVGPRDERDRRDGASP